MIVSVKRYGGLGNQLFQIAACIGASLKFNVPYAIPKDTLDNQKWEPYNNFDNVNYFEEEPDFSKYVLFKEPAFTYTDIPKPRTRDLLLDGYFQSEKYFRDYRKQILEAFEFDFTTTKNRTVALHVRRGDYVNLPTIHPVITIEYIARAIEYFEELGYYRFYIFSDDMEWCQENINKTIFNWSDFKYSEGKSALNDLILMAGCEHNIISNSSFSWWGHYLNNNPNKIVVRPAVWFGADNDHDISDLCPENWIAL